MPAAGPAPGRRADRQLLPGTALDAESGGGVEEGGQSHGPLLHVALLHHGLLDESAHHGEGNVKRGLS